MANKYLDQQGLLYLAGKIKNDFVKKEDGKGLSTNDLTNALKEKLDGVAAGAQVNVLEGVKVNGVALEATEKVVDIAVPTKVSELDNDSEYITLDQVPEGAAASNTTPLMDGVASVGTETAFARGDHKHPSDTTKVDKTTTVNGYALSSNVTLTSDDVGAVPTTRTVNGKALSTNINLTSEDVNAVPTTRTVNGQALSADVTLDYEDVGAVPVERTVNGKALSANITLNYEDVGAASVDHTHAEVTTTAAGLMSAADKVKLDGVETGANKTVVDSALSASSSNPVENKVVKAALDGKSDTTHTHNYAGSATPGGAATTALETTGNSATATALKTARTITVGNKANTFDGTADISFSLADIGAIPTSQKGAANGVASLDADGKVPSSQLPSYVDDVVEGYYYNEEFYSDSAHTSKLTAEGSKIYVDLDTNKTYRFGGTVYVEITSGDMVALTNSEIEALYQEA